ncbi:brain expressed, associated with Nedd4 isoform 1 [Pseudomonas fluorescens Q2-87]|uniref:Brain expressed, associated with Nedd4 isoform 1 n=1 Tax=Pseudomonas fluorescens (strain Q2-87) TaxID=1038922 RepID=J2YBT4_PSEFQ|nr:brain expressed, associated with Nedd4 isoform 1 [Pseudomonas fluorescens Q2-87]
MQAEPPLSRASSLPQGLVVDTESVNTREQMWERACSRRRRHIHHQGKLTHRYREQARSHRG